MSVHAMMSFAFWGLVAVLLVLPTGCGGKGGEKVAEDVKDAANQAAEKVSKGAQEMVKEGQQIAADLSDKAKEYLNPLKEKFGNLEGLKKTPEKLKTAVTELIQSIEDKAADIKLPESVSNALSKIKEKLVALKEYLQGEVEEAKLDEKVKDVMDSVKSGLGFKE